MSEEMKNKIINMHNIDNITINPDIPFVTNFFGKDGKVDIGLMEQWCKTNGYDYLNKKIKQRNFTHNVNNIVITDPNGKVVADMFSKKANYKDDIAEVVVSRIAKKVGINAVTTYMSNNPTGSKGTIAENGIPAGCKFIEIGGVLPDGNNDRNCLLRVFEVIKNIKNSTFGQADPLMQVDPHIYTDLMKLAVFDFCTGQNDRNVFNYGLIYNKEKHTLELGAVWDNGNSFAFDNKYTYRNVSTTINAGRFFSSITQGCGCEATAQGITDINDQNFMESIEILRQIDSPEFAAMVKEYGVDMKEVISFAESMRQVDVEELNAEAAMTGDFVVPEEETAIISGILYDRSSKIARVLTQSAESYNLLDPSQGGGQGDD